MTTLIGYVKEVLDTLKSDIESVLGSSYTHPYSIKTMIRIPDRDDKFPVLYIIPKTITPYYIGMGKTLENANLELRVIMAIKKPLDYDGTQLLDDLDTLMGKLYDIRLDTTKWLMMDYDRGITITSDIADRWVFQTAEVSIRIKIN